MADLSTLSVDYDTFSGPTLNSNKGGSGMTTHASSTRVAGRRYFLGVSFYIATYTI